MIKLLVGLKGSRKTNRMIDSANEAVGTAEGSIIFINKNHRLMYDLKHKIRVICMEDYPKIINTDEYIGFIYGIVSGDHDIEKIYIDSVLKHAEINIEDIPSFLDRLEDISKEYKIEFTVSISAEASDLGPAADKYEIL
jgi:hypothetical protein